jgi:hypothetical protein
VPAARSHQLDNGYERAAGFIRKLAEDKIHAVFHQDYAPSKSEGPVQFDTKITDGIIKGTGKFIGIKGNITTTTKQLKPEKGELAGKSVSDMVLNYSK